MVHILGPTGIDAHRLRLHHMPHHIEIVAALFDQRAARVPAEPVPVPDFLQKGKAVLANGKHFECT